MQLAAVFTAGTLLGRCLLQERVPLRSRKQALGGGCLEAGSVQGVPGISLQLLGKTRVEVQSQPWPCRNAGTGRTAGRAGGRGGTRRAVGPDAGARLKWGKCPGFLSHKTTDTRVHGSLPHSASAWHTGHCIAPQRAKQAALLRTFGTQWNGADGKPNQNKRLFSFLM